MASFSRGKIDLVFPITRGAAVLNGNSRELEINELVRNQYFGEILKKKHYRNNLLKKKKLLGSLLVLISAMQDYLFLKKWQSSKEVRLQLQNNQNPASGDGCDACSSLQSFTLFWNNSIIQPKDECIPCESTRRARAESDHSLEKLHTDI